jgi:hypothetical protein
MESPPAAVVVAVYETALHVTSQSSGNLIQTFTHLQNEFVTWTFEFGIFIVSNVSSCILSLCVRCDMAIGEPIGCE